MSVSQIEYLPHRAFSNDYDLETKDCIMLIWWWSVASRDAPLLNSAETTQPIASSISVE